MCRWNLSTCSLYFWNVLSIFLPALVFAFTIDFAIKHRSDEELKGGRRFLMALQKVNIERRNTVWERIVVSAKGKNRLDFLHPSIASRIEKIESALRDRKIQIDDDDTADDTAVDQHRLILLKSYMTQTICALEHV